MRGGRKRRWRVREGREWGEKREEDRGSECREKEEGKIVPRRSIDLFKPISGKRSSSAWDTLRLW